MRPGYRPAVTINKELLTFEHFEKTLIGSARRTGAVGKKHSEPRCLLNSDAYRLCNRGVSGLVARPLPSRYFFRLPFVN